jgi:hypothetical protein
MYVYIEIYVLLSFNFDTLLSANVKECLLFDCFNMLCIDCHGNKYIDYVGRCCYSLDTGIFVRLSERVDYVSEIPQIRSIQYRLSAVGDNCVFVDSFSEGVSDAVLKI